jgi:hypothetical protein
MPLDPSFWDDLPTIALPSRPCGPWFTQPIVLTGALTTPQRFLRINRGDQLRVSWPLKNGHPVLVSVKTSWSGRSNTKTYGLIVGWANGGPPTVVTLGWLPLDPKLLALIKMVYKEEARGPVTMDSTIKRTEQGIWEVQGHDFSILTDLRAQSPLKHFDIEQDLRKETARWPGGPVAEGLF